MKSILVALALIVLTSFQVKASGENEGVVSDGSGVNKQRMFHALEEPTPIRIHLQIEKSRRSSNVDEETLQNLKEQIQQYLIESDLVELVEIEEN